MCKHEKARVVLAGTGLGKAAPKWCPHCGGVFDGTRWHRHSGHAAPKKRHVQRDAFKHARIVAGHARKKSTTKKRSPAQRAATARMLAAAKARRGRASK